MIRYVAIGALSTLLLLVLYLPSAHPPERFIQQLHDEHLHAYDVWGATTANRILHRAMIIESRAETTPPLPTRASTPSEPHGTGAVQHEMAQVNRRLFDNLYFRSIDALFVLAIYRFSALLEWLPKCTFFLLAFLVDALAERVIKAKEFRRHDPEVFALYLSIAIVALCACVLAMVSPWPLHPAAWAVAPLGMAVLVGRAAADFHRRA
ncbi:MAG: DUF4400 domain-containing protein [Xanthomonadaceae bacterium]|nr:DUF4400 domain-containing protein [Xanthomonadaceae bacterium]